MESGYLMPGVKRRDFDNGLTVLTEKIPKAETAAVILGIKVSLLEEGEELNGIRHLIEHLLFKGNEHKSAQEIVRSMEWSGSIVNAVTGDEDIIFQAETIPSGVNNILELVYQMVRNLRHDPKEFLTEQERVLGEIRMYRETPRSYFTAGVFVPKILKNSPYARPIEGTIKSVTNITQEQLEEFKRQYFVPNLETLIVIGEFNEKEVIKKIKETFGKQPFENLVLPNPPSDLTNTKIEFCEEKEGVENAYMCLGYKIPSFNHPDAHKLKLLSAILGLGMSSRLSDKLSEEKGIGYGVGMNIYTFREMAVLMSYVAEFDPKRLQEAKEIILNEFHDLKTRPLTDEELEGVKNHLIFIHKKLRRDIELWAKAIFAKILEDVPYNIKEFPSLIRQVSKEDIMEVANKYLTDQYTFTALIPKKSWPQRGLGYFKRIF